jgi:hypothetical protein
MAQVVEHLPSQARDAGFKPHYCQRKKNKIQNTGKALYIIKFPIIKII